VISIIVAGGRELVRFETSALLDLEIFLLPFDYHAVRRLADEQP
jgi:hypothetical protein